MSRQLYNLIVGSSTGPVSSEPLSPSQPPTLLETTPSRPSVSSANRWLLVLACSATKRTTPGLLPAIERYDGLSYRVLAKFKRESELERKQKQEGDGSAAALARLDILILSAKYAWLLPDDPIENYDQIMSRARALELQAVVGSYFDYWLGSHAPYQEIYLNLGQNYRLALATSVYLSAAIQPSPHQLQTQTQARIKSTQLVLAQGGIGQRAAQLKKWLYTLPS